MPSAAFQRFWRTDLARECFLACTSRKDLANLRLVSNDVAHYVAVELFREITIKFNPITFTRLSRIAALERIGFNVRSVHVEMPHTSDTFLPPLLDPETGEELSFVYEPQINVRRPRSSSSSSSDGSKYGTWEIDDILVRQYPPLFHAATNIPSFIRAFTAMSNLRHLAISTPDQPAGQRYRRSVVDYALISLRIAVEQSPLSQLDSLTLSPIHPSALFYLRPLIGVGTLPNSTRVWHQIRTLNMTMDTVSLGADLPTDHLKFVHLYLQSFTSQLTSFSFKWTGKEGPSPISIPLEPCMSPACSSETPRTCPQSTNRASHKPLKFRKLESLLIENVLTDASQISVFILSHRKVLRDFRFENTQLRSGTWDDAFEPLTKISGGEEWKKKVEEVMDVPLLFSPTEVTDVKLDECIDEMLWEDEGYDSISTHKRRHRAMSILRRASQKIRSMNHGVDRGLYGEVDKPLPYAPDHLRRFLRSSRMFSWR